MMKTSLMRIALTLIFTLPLMLRAAVAPVPPPGIAVTAADRATLASGLSRLGSSIDALKGNPLLPDVLIYHKAVRFALEGNEFFKPEEVERAKELLKTGQERADALARGTAPWAAATGLVVRGYISKIDGSAQPYGLVVPPTWFLASAHRFRLDAWFHGRNETLSEVNFIWDSQKNAGEFTPKDTIVLRLYGRYCNANKFAGEVDLFEAIDAVKRQYSIDERRIVVRGFSMGGAAAWQFATHYAGLWAAAAPGAGFAETREFVPAYHKQEIHPTWYEEKLWHLTDATDYALNLYQCPTVAYNGDLDPQKQAADIMERYLAQEGMHLTRVTGLKTGHKYTPEAKVEINRIVDAAADRGMDPYPRKVHFTTWTLAYNRMKWITLDGLEKHWERARVDAAIPDDHSLKARTSNVTQISFDMGSGGAPFDELQRVTVSLDGQNFLLPGPLTDRSWSAHFRKSLGKWTVIEGDDGTVRKRHGLQGPIDDAFLDSFIMVRPTGTPMQPDIAQWAAGEQAHAIREWRRQFRGEAQVRDDTAVTAADIANSNLVLWGDPQSNQVLARIVKLLPIGWTRDAVTVGKRTFPASTHALLMIYPNPLNPKKYVVLNSGVTFREFDYQSNARQVAKLPDYAVVGISTPADENAPGKIVEAGFFDEQWQLR